MLTRKDLVAAHRLMTQRAGQALMLAEPDNPDRPLRRIGIGMFSGFMVGVLLIAGWGITGLITKDGTLRNMDAQTVLIAKGTGTKYVVCGVNKDRLCTAANFASARLAVGGTTVKVRTVATKSLSKFQRGPLIGIPGAPDALPSSLVGTPWTVCASSVLRAGNRIPSASLAVGRSLGGTPMASNTAVIVAAGQKLWLVTGGTRMELPRSLLSPLAGDYRPAQVPPVWLNGLVPGPQFKTPEIAGYGTKRKSPLGGIARVGQTFTTAATGASAQQFFVLLREGLAPISKTEAWLLENTPGARAPVPISRTMANAAQSQARLPERGLPESLPEIMPYDGQTPLCAVYQDPSNGTAQLTLGASLPVIADTAPVGTRPDRLDQVVMRTGTGVLAGIMQNSPNVTGYVLVTEDGRKFPIGSNEDLAKLGYREAQAMRVPSHLLQLMPQGPVLDGRDAVKEVP